MSKLTQDSSAPLLFNKRSLMSEKAAAQYVGTDTELDTKEAMAKPGVPAMVLKSSAW